jgi:hypothetical protein
MDQTEPTQQDIEDMESAQAHQQAMDEQAEREMSEEEQWELNSWYLYDTLRTFAEEYGYSRTRELVEEFFKKNQ